MSAGAPEIHRYERKFLVDRMNYPGFENFLLTRPETFTRAYAPRRINNIYFDTPGLTAYEDNLGGNSAKRKYRIRWYGPADLGSEVAGAALEIKIKEGSLNRKVRYPLPSFRYADVVVPRAFLDLIRQAGMAPRHFEELACMQPVLLNSYQRKYHLSFDRRFRFTSDFDLVSAHPAFPQSLSSSRSRPFDSVIVELKYAQSDDEAAEAIIQAFPVRVRSCSKFMMGIQASRR
jgi:hypothetical protein